MGPHRVAMGITLLAKTCQSLETVSVRSKYPVLCIHAYDEGIGRFFFFSLIFNLAMLKGVHFLFDSFFLNKFYWSIVDLTVLY